MENADNNLTSSILESISDGVFTVDREWKITSFNRAAERITGVSRKDAIGQNCFEVFKSNMCESSCPLGKTMKTGKPLIDRSGYCVRKDGRRIPISVSTAILSDDEGRVLGGAETFRDLSELEDLKKELREKQDNGSFTSRSRSMEHLLSILPSVAQSDTTILIQGETGTGKEVFARQIHRLSPRQAGPFVAVNCGALPENLLESELFGYRKGAFTGADRDYPGRFSGARGGTLFLDEIGEIPLALQVKLLRVLQEREYQPLGSEKTVKTDVRIVCATNRDLSAMVQDGTFRSDLYYRINVIRLDLPPLRERKEDLPDLVAALLQRIQERTGKGAVRLTSDLWSALYSWHWPGNIRELENALERAVVLSSGHSAGLEHLPPEMAGSFPDAYGLESPVPVQPAAARIFRVREEAERAVILEALEENNWNRRKTADMLDMNTSTLWRKMKRFSISGSEEKS